MGNLVTIADMRTRARRMASMENSTFVTDAELNDLLFSSLRRLTNRLHGQGQEYDRKTVETNTVPGQYLYALPTDFYRLQLLCCERTAVMPTPSNSWVEAASDSDTWRLMEPFMLQQLPTLMNTRYSGSELLRYRLRGGHQTVGDISPVTSPVRQLEIRPTPRAIYTLRLDYLPVTRMPSGGGEDAWQVDGLNGFENIPVLEAVIFMLQKEESDASSYQAWLLREEKALEQVAPAQDATSPEMIVDLLGIDDGGLRPDRPPRGPLEAPMTAGRDQRTGLTPEDQRHAQLLADLQGVLRVPFLKGLRLPDLALVAGVNRIDHKLGRAYQGWFPLRVQDAALVAFEQASDDPRRALVLNVAAPCVCDLWVF